MSIHSKLIEIQQTLKVQKTQLNKHGNFMYRTCEGILEAVKPLLKEHELILIISDEIIPCAPRFYVEATVILSDGSDKIIAKAYARDAEEQKGFVAAQLTGSASSYARKYALQGMFLIDDGAGSDIDSQSKNDTGADTLTDEQIEEIQNLIETAGVTETLICNWIKADSLAEISQEKHQNVINKLNATIEKKVNKNGTKNP